MKTMLVALSALIAAGCHPVPNPSPPDASDAAVDAGEAEAGPDAAVDAGGAEAGPDAAVDAGGDEAGPDAGDACEQAGATLLRLRCRDELGEPYWEGWTGQSFAERCRETHNEMGWDLECIATLSSCAELDRAATGELCAEQIKEVKP